MTNHRDPIEDWLSSDIEVLPPAPGTFQRVRRQARRRKAIQVFSAAAGVAVIVVAGVSVPTITNGLFSRTTASKVNPGASPHPGHSAARYFRGPALPDAARGTRPPPGFRPTSVTFVQAGALGAVLGSAPCGRHLCTAMAGTTSYGRSWNRVGAPKASPPSVTQVRFADSGNGWAFGPALWATHNGGGSWTRVTAVTGQVVDLSAVDGWVLAVTATGCTGTGAASGPGTGCRGFELYKAAITSNKFDRVLNSPSGGQVTPGGLQLQASTKAGYLIAGGRLYSGALAGGGWGVVPAESTANPGCMSGQATANPAALAPGANVLYAVCGSGSKLRLYRSASSGRTWQVAGGIPAAASATSLAISPAGTLVLATTQGLYYKSGSVRTWTQVTSGGASGREFRYVGMTTARLGVAVPSAASGEIFVTSNGGRTWRPSKISP